MTIEKDQNNFFFLKAKKELYFKVPAVPTSNNKENFK